jgi:hypothetical protein
VDIRENHAAIAPQGFVAQDFAGQGFAGQGFAAQDLVAQRAPMGGFTTEDILWAAGIWSVILTLSPVIVFYMLMVA